MDEEIKVHLAAIEQWLAEHRANVRSSAQGLSSDERKQLHVVNKSIQQLSGLGVSIPDELRQLKLQLSAKDAVRPTIGATPASLAEVAELASALSKLAQAAKTIHKQIKTPDKAPVAMQRYEVTLEDLIQSGHLSTDDKLEFSWQKGGQVFEGTVSADGTIMAKTHSGWKSFESLSAAAMDIAECSLNGWLHWRRINADGSRTTLKDIRTKFMNKKLTPP